MQLTVNLLADGRTTSLRSSAISPCLVTRRCTTAVTGTTPRIWELVPVRTVSNSGAPRTVGSREHCDGRTLPMCAPTSRCIKKRLPLAGSSHTEPRPKSFPPRSSLKSACSWDYVPSDGVQNKGELLERYGYQLSGKTAALSGKNAFGGIFPPPFRHKIYHPGGRTKGLPATEGGLAEVEQRLGEVADNPSEVKQDPESSQLLRLNRCGVGAC